MADTLEDVAAALTTNDIAKILKVKLPRVQELVRQGILPHFRLGRQIRIDRRQLQHFIERGGQPLPGGWRRTTEAADVEGEIGRSEVSR
jgi:excisionase family DNA binding protein